MFECERCHSNNHNTRNTEAITVLRMVTSHPGGQNAFSRGACYPRKISVKFGGRPNYLSDIHAGPGNWRLQLISCVTTILPPQIQRHSQNTIPLIQSLFSKLFRWDSLFDVVVGRHEERNV